MVVLLSSTKKIKSLLKMYWVVGAYHVFESEPTIRALLPTVLGKFGVTAVQLHRTVIFFLCYSIGVFLHFLTFLSFGKMS